MKRNGSMNHIYRLVWSHVLSAWVAVAENTKGKGKGKNARSKLVAAALSLTAVAFVLPEALAGPTGGQVTSGAATIKQSGATTTIIQTSQNVSLNWNSFNIGSQETVNFVQPSTISVAVNRILGNSASQIFGHLNANGEVFLINPNGIVFGQGAQVNVGSLVASTLDLNSANNGTLGFGGTGKGSIINQGTITARQGGSVILLGNTVSNQGLITAQLGTVAMGAGSAVTLTFNGDRLVHLQVDQSTLNNLVANGGILRADGGTVIMTAGAKESLLASVVNNTGVIEAQTVSNQSGTITLLGGMNAGTVNVGGTLDASAPNGGNGGHIDTSAEHVHVANSARITTAAPKGSTGSWLIDPSDFTIAASGGDITGATLSSELLHNSIEIQSTQGTVNTNGSGNINVNDVVSWSANQLTLTAANSVNINTTMNGSGTASLYLKYAQDSSFPAGTYNINAPVNLPSGQSLTTQQGGNAALVYTVINSLGAQGSTTGTDLQGINGNLSGYFALGSNIDASATANWNVSNGVAAGFTPIGGSGMFTGNLDGLGHSISHLAIDATQTNGPAGLVTTIGATSVVQNVNLVNALIAGRSIGILSATNRGTINNVNVSGTANGHFNTGGLVGQNYGVIVNSGSAASVSLTGTGAVNGGGLVGLNRPGSTIVNSHSSGASVTDLVNPNTNTGGLVGENAGTISNSYSTDSVNGLGLVGGLVGLSTGSISTSYSNGVVSGTYGVGGLVGSNSGTITDVYTTGNVSGTGSNVGGLIGTNTGTVTNGYWNTDVNLTGFGADAGTVNFANPNGSANTSVTSGGLTTSQMQHTSNFVGFGFTAVPGATGNNWVMIDVNDGLNNINGWAGGTYPMLISEYATNITNAHQLQLIAIAPGASYTLQNAIDASATTAALGNIGTGNGVAVVVGSDIWSTSEGFVSIGQVGNHPFTGNFYGQGNSISNLTVNVPTRNQIGLFGSLVGGTIDGVELVGASVTGNNSVGALLGSNSGNVVNSSATGSVNGASEVGGLVGYNTAGATISAGSVSGAGVVNGSGNNIGGLVGRNDGAIDSSDAGISLTGADGQSFYGGMVGLNNGTISNSHAAASIQSVSFDAGGLVGKNTGSITSSYATGAITVNATAGGLVADNAGTIADSYATTTVTAGSFSGGLVGSNELNAVIQNSYSSGAVTGAFNFEGGLVGANFGSILGSHTTGASVVAGGVSGSMTSQEIGGLVGYNNGTIGSYTGAGINTASYASGTVTGTTIVGGLVGRNGSSGTISNASVSAGATVSATEDLAGGLVGLNYGSISSSNAANTVSGQYYVGGLVGASLSTSNSQQASITGSSASGAVTGTSIVGGLVGGNGTDASILVNGNSFSGGLISNSHASGQVSGPNGAQAGSASGGLVAINNGATIDHSSATGNVVAGLNAGGLVGLNTNGTISNSTSSGNVTGAYFDGGLVGVNSTNSVISNSSASGSVTAGDLDGGLVGENNGSISNSYATGNVHGNVAGGLVGRNENGGAITTSFATGNVSGTSDVGGLVGQNNFYNNVAGTIANSYATGAVTGNVNVGGLVGENVAGSTITNTYATGLVTGAVDGSTAPSNVGALVGSNAGTLAASFWNSDINGSMAGVNGVSTGASGLTGSGMMSMANFSNTGWSITNTGGGGSIWRIYEGSTAPLLDTFLTQLTVTVNGNVTSVFNGSNQGGNLFAGNVSCTNGCPLTGVFGSLFGTALNSGTYHSSGAGLYSNQFGYDISVAGSGSLTIVPFVEPAGAVTVPVTVALNTTIPVAPNNSMVSVDLSGLYTEVDQSDTDLRNRGAKTAVNHVGVTVAGGGVRMPVSVEN